MNASMAEIFGDFVYTDAKDQEYLLIGFSPTSIPLEHRWRNNGLLAGFLSDYLSSFFPGDDSASAERREEIKSAVSYIANELLENAMKFNYTASEYPINIGMYLDQGKVRFYVTNSVAPDTVAGFQDLIKRLLAEDPNELFVHTLKNEGDKNSGSGLGYLTMITDYGVRLGWKFEPHHDDPKVMNVTTLAQLPI